MELAGQVWTNYYNPRTSWWTWEVIRLKKVLPGFVSQWDCWCKNLGVGGVWGHKTRLLVSIKVILANWQTTQEGDAVLHLQYIKWLQNTEQALYPPEVIWGCVGVWQFACVLWSWHSITSHGVDPGVSGLLLWAICSLYHCSASLNHIVGNK